MACAMPLAPLPSSRSPGTDRRLVGLGPDGLRHAACFSPFTRRRAPTEGWSGRDRMACAMPLDCQSPRRIAAICSSQILLASSCPFVLHRAPPTGCCPRPRPMPQPQRGSVGEPGVAAQPATPGHETTPAPSNPEMGSLALGLAHSSPLSVLCVSAPLREAQGLESRLARGRMPGVK
jgi:hypothetical protein